MRNITATLTIHIITITKILKSAVSKTRVPTFSIIERKNKTKSR